MKRQHVAAAQPPTPAKPDWRWVPDPYGEMANYKINQHGQIMSYDRTRFGRQSSSGKSAFSMDDGLVYQFWDQGSRYVALRGVCGAMTRSVNKLLRHAFPELYKCRRDVNKLAWFTQP